MEEQTRSLAATEGGNHPGCPPSALRPSQHLLGKPSPSCSLPPSTLLSLWGTLSSWEGTLRASHHAVPRALRGQQIPEPALERGHETATQVRQRGGTCSPGRCRWRWTGRAGSGHSTASWGWLRGPAGAGRRPWRTGQGERQEDGGLQGRLHSRGDTHREAIPATDCSSLTLGPCLAHTSALNAG